MSNINRRAFLKRTGAAGAVIGATSLVSSCTGGAGTDQVVSTVNPSASVGEKPMGEMTYRTNRRGDDKISILGYGCMRWPTTTPDATGNDIDQQRVNELVDYAIAHGVNYFDSSPVYCKGFSEKATGIALAKYPRKSYYIATKMSNFNESFWPREASQKMFYESLKNFNTDYIDYYLLHSIGGGGLDNFRKRFIDNGILDWLMELRARVPSATWASPSMAKSRCSTGVWPTTTSTIGTSCRFR